MTSARSGTVFISEEVDATDAWRLAGNFSAHWEAEDGDADIEGPEGVPLEEAIAWGRGMARIVLLRLGDDDEMYSVGETDPDFPVRQWPPEGKTVRPRPYETSDDGAEQAVAWRLESTIRDHVLPAVEVFGAQLESDSRVQDVEVSPPKDGVVVARYTVTATGGDGAVRLGDDAVAQVLRSLSPGFLGKNVGTVTSTAVLGRP